ncbi:MAG TPA: alpha/beta fold hydrolase [Acidimicrobiia bacterium]|jgi:pimeloyl-ACP methyl ester carboxylesterase
MRPVRRARPTPVLLVILILTALLATAAAAVPAGADSARSSLTWRACGSGFQCSTLAVPLDASAPERTVDLAVVRVRARDSDSRIGTLVVNPGGPGVPAVEYLRGVASTLPEAVRDRFDLVAFDPRGVGASEPVECLDSLDPVFDEAFEPTTAVARTELVDEMTALAQQCAARNGDLLGHVSTLDAADDLEQLRIALGEDRLSFLGYSYGTFLGATYAQHHPDRVRAFVLDGPVDPSMSARAVTLAQARGFEQALDDFLDHCSDQRGCAFHHGGDAAAAYDALRATAGRTPLATSDPDGRTLNQTRFDAAVLQQLYLGRAAWSGLADALAAAERGDASTLLAGADGFVGRTDDGGDDHALESFWAVTCLDGPVVTGADAAAQLEKRAVEVAPRMGAFIVNNSLPCSVWPVPPVAPAGRLTAAGAPPILVIGTTFDPATPLAQARSLAGGLERGRLLVADGEQHTSFNNGNQCVDDIVVKYLVDRKVPRIGTRC